MKKEDLQPKQPFNPEQEKEDYKKFLDKEYNKYSDNESTNEYAKAKSRKLKNK